MQCHVCGGRMEGETTTLPFKVSDRSIVIVKSLPVYQCTSCSEYLLEDAVMERVDRILTEINAAAELEVIEFAA